jgi:hypothetical protein
MKIVKSIQNAISLIKGKSPKAEIIQRLLEQKSITAAEAIILLDKQPINIYVEKLEMSSGARITGGDDNHVDY